MLEETRETGAQLAMLFTKAAIVRCHGEARTEVDSNPNTGSGVLRCELRGLYRSAQIPQVFIDPARLL